MESTRQLIGYEEAMRLTGLPRRTFFRRIATEAVPTHIDGRDRRRRLIDRADAERMVRAEPVERAKEAA